MKEMGRGRLLESSFRMVCLSWSNINGSRFIQPNGIAVIISDTCILNYTLFGLIMQSGFVSSQLTYSSFPCFQNSIPKSKDATSICMVRVILYEGLLQ